jgi:hypothetical protein
VLAALFENWRAIERSFHSGWSIRCFQAGLKRRSNDYQQHGLRFHFNLDRAVGVVDSPP